MKRGVNAIVRTHSDNAFSVILADLVERVPGCHAVAFVDQEGEAVDIAGYGEEYDIKVAAAHCCVLLHDAAALAPISTYAIGAGRRSYLIRSLPEGYTLVLILSQRAAFHVSPRALIACTHALSVEADFTSPVRRMRWFPVEVLPRGHKNLRPVRLRAKSTEWQGVTILGAIVGLARGERGYRVRLENGAEMSLVREPLGRWWVDENQG